MVTGNFDGHRKYIFFSEKCLENGFYGLKSMRGCVFGYYFYRGAQEPAHNPQKLYIGKSCDSGSDSISAIKIN